MKKVSVIICGLSVFLFVLAGCSKTDELSVAAVSVSSELAPVKAGTDTEAVSAAEATEETSFSGQGGYENFSGTALYSDEFSEIVPVTPTEPDELFYTVYRIRKGDMIGFLAEDYGVTQDTLISVNNIKQTRYIQPGDYIRIPNMAGIVYTVREDGETLESIATKYEVDADKCARINELALADELTAGTTLFVPGAELDWVTRQEINGDLFHKPIHSSYRISSYFGWRASPFTGARSYHSGIDLACSNETKIYCALAGTVSSVAYNDTYGYHVIVTHHSGYKTLYGHMIKWPSVEVGQHVKTTTVLGYVGSTGLSTGPHLHFTVYKNGVAVNPASLWG